MFDISANVLNRAPVSAGPPAREQEDDQVNRCCRLHLGLSDIGSSH
jgi:hypothetical protein